MPGEKGATSPTVSVSSDHGIEENGKGVAMNGEGKRQYVEDPVRIKAILRKCDIRILPVLSILYLLSFLDRTAIGNAKVAGLATDLKMTSQEYNTATTVFFVLYGLLEVPSNLMLKKFGTKLWIPFIMFWWGVTMTLTSIVKTYEGLLVARLALGAAEAGLFPGVTYYLTTWYKRDESQFRLGVFFGAATAAGAFGGLLAYLLSKLDGKAGLAGWSWIFLVEGLITVVCAIWAYFVIIDSPQTAKFLTQEERDILDERLRYDGVDTPMNDEYKLKFVIEGLTDWKCWTVFIIYVGVLCPVYSVALNLPAITVGLGYSGPNAQLITIPVYVCATFFVIVLALISDRYHLRSPVIIGGSFLTLAGYLILLFSYNNAVRYFGAFCAASGAYGSFPSVVCLLTNNVGGRTKRTTEIGILIGIGGMCGMISSNIFRTGDAPHYSHGLRVNILLTGIAIVASVFMNIMLRLANRRKQRMIDSGEAARLTLEELADLGDRSPYFTYTY